MLKKGTLLLLVTYLLSLQQVSANTLIERTIGWYKANIIEHKTDSKLYDIKIWVHPKDWGTLRSIMNTVWWVTGVNGVFECPKDYAACWWKNYTVNERYINGKKKAQYKSTGDRVVFGWDKNIKPFLFQTDTINANKEWEIWEGFANHPLLLKEWVSQVWKYHKKGLIDYKMKRKGTRNFICSDKQGKTIYFGLVYNITMDALAPALKDLWCWNALNLDAWYSTSFIYNGKYITWPQRDILDWVFIVPKWVDTEEVKEESKRIMRNLLKKIQPLPTHKKIESLNNLNTQLYQTALSIYKKNTSKVWADTPVYKKTLIVSWKEKPELVKEFSNSDAFKKSDTLILEKNNIYKREVESINKKEVWTRIDINSVATIEKIYLINMLREYAKALIVTYKEIEKIEYIKKLDTHLKINIDL